MKKMPLPFAISLVLLANTAFAQTPSTTVDQRLEAIESLLDSLTFTGYVRYGLSVDDKNNGNFPDNLIKADGESAGTAVGRLGNEIYGGEFGIIKSLTGENGSKWDMTVYVEEYGSAYESSPNPNGIGTDFYLSKFNIAASNLFASQPELSIWAGRDYNQRPQEGLNDYKFMEHDGQGAGFKNLALGATRFDLAVVQDLEQTDNYAATAKLYVPFSQDIHLDLYANFGTSERSLNANPNTELENATLVAAILNLYGHKISARYSNNNDNSVHRIENGINTFYGSYQYLWRINKKLAIDTFAAIHVLENENNEPLNRNNYSAIIRPTYAWNDTYSTWLEAGYSQVDYIAAKESNSAWKLTLSQNISIDSDYLKRPMIRFFASVGQANNKVDADIGTVRPRVETDIQKDAFIVGAMFETWW